MKLTEWISEFTEVVGSHKTAMDKLTEALENVKTANDTLYSSLSKLGDIDMSDFLGAGWDLKGMGIDNYVDLAGIAGANPLTEIMGAVKGISKLFNF
jgi:hypothetical protein